MLAVEASPKLNYFEEESITHETVFMCTKVRQALNSHVYYVVGIYL
jgi:hypothetical protein